MIMSTQALLRRWMQWIMESVTEMVLLSKSKVMILHIRSGPDSAFVLYF